MKRFILHSTYTMCTAALLISCELFDYHPYDTRVNGKHNINAQNIQRIEKDCHGKETITFVVISDTQRWYDETNDAVKSINAHDSVDFVIHCGDISDFGVTKEFTIQRDMLEKLNVPYVVILGNHDCLGTGCDTYRYVFGSPNFSFTAGNTHFVCLNTNAFEYDYSVAIPDFTFIKSDYSNLSPEVTRTVVAMHAMPHSDQFNNNVADLFETEISNYKSLQFCLCGHGHATTVKDIFNDSILYYECGAAKGRAYLLFTLNQDKTYTYEVVKY